MLTDDSAGEQCAVRKAFGGLVDGEMEVTHLLCKVHTLHTLRTWCKQYQGTRAFYGRFV